MIKSKIHLGIVLQRYLLKLACPLFLPVFRKSCAKSVIANIPASCTATWAKKLIVATGITTVPLAVYSFSAEFNKWPILTYSTF